MKKNQIDRKFQVLITFLFLFCFQSKTIYPNFSQYIIKFGKSYLSSSQYIKRQLIYNKNIKNFQNITIYIPGINEMTDWTLDEIKTRKTLKLFNNSYKIGLSQSGYNNIFVGATTSIPSSLDWRDYGLITSIKNQGACGDCFAFATVATAQSFVINNKRFTNTTINLSQQYIFSCSKLSTCSGGTLQDAMSVGLQIPTESSYPYHPFSPPPLGICSANGLHIANTYSNYYNVPDASIINFLALGPIAISIASVGWQYYGAGVYQCPIGAQVDHAVELIGYTATYWIIKNQWGSSWGINGYMYISRSRLVNCAIGTSIHLFSGSYADTSNDYKFIDSNGSGSDSSNISIIPLFQEKLVIVMVSLVIVSLFGIF